jgi:uncharacterized Zn-binding protein involved in type VI secretion
MSNAARLGDNHTCPCPAHVGGPVLPACSANVTVGSKPAARMGDMLTCVPAPDVIQRGEPTVTINSQQAARLGDPTVHGGIIVEGCPTVIIGKAAGDAKRSRLEERQAMVDAGRNKAAGMPDGPEKQRLQDACNRLERNNVAVERARLSQAVYDDYGAPPGWQRLTGDQLPPEIRAQSVYDPATGTLNDPKTGFHAAVFRSEVDGSYVLAYRGTQPTSWRDWVLGNAQGAGANTPQYRQAFDLANATHAAYGDNLSMTGHSLGGGLAATGSLATGVPADTFNAAGVHGWTMDRYGLDGSQANNLINAYNVDGEVLTGLQESTWAPDAIGVNHNLPAVDAAGNPRPSGRVESNQGGILGWLRKPIDGARSLAGQGQEAVTRHGIDIAINGLEAQKQADMATIGGALQ